MIFFADENISQYAARMLDIFDREHQVRPFLDHFKEGTPDLEWIPTVASWEGCVVAVCGDGRILRNNVEKQVLKESGLMFVYLTSGWTNLKWPDFAWKIVKAWPDIVKNVEDARYPMVFKVPVSGSKIRGKDRISNL